MTLREQWDGALSRVVIRHIDPTCRPDLTVLGTDDAPALRMTVLDARDTRDQGKRFDCLEVNTTKLTYWPGNSVAQAYIAAAWAGYLMHEALELVTESGAAVLDPHREPFAYDRGLRIGMPRELTPQTLRAALEIVMLPDAADAIIRGAQ